MTEQMVRTNLHNHTSWSDGSYDPSVSLAFLAANVQFGAISDHDTTGGWEQILGEPLFSRARRGQGYFIVRRSAERPPFFEPISMEGIVGADELMVYQGMEMTVAYENRDGQPKSVHILGLGIDSLVPPIRRRLGRLTSYRYERLRAMTNEINLRSRGEYVKEEVVLPVGIYGGCTLGWEEPDGVRKIAGGSESPTKLHVGIALSRVLSTPDHHISPRECMDKYVSGLDASAFDHTLLYSAQEGIDVLKQQLRGVAVLAHPQRTAKDLGMTIDELVERFVPLGIQALDANTPEDFARLTHLADRYNLFITGGADSHGKYDEGWRSGSPYVEIPLSHLLRLNAAIAVAKGIPDLTVRNEEPHS